LGVGVWGLATEDVGFRVCGRISFVYEAVAEAEAEAEAELGSPEAAFFFAGRGCSGGFLVAGTERRRIFVGFGHGDFLGKLDHGGVACVAFQPADSHSVLASMNCIGWA